MSERVELFPNVMVTVEDATEILEWLKQPEASRFFGYLAADSEQHALSVMRKETLELAELEQVRGRMWTANALHPIRETIDDLTENIKAAKTT